LGPDRGRRLDDLSALHPRILAHELAAADELAAMLVRMLKQRLRRRWTGIDEAALHDAAVDAVMHYLRDPNLFDTTRGVPLEAFICGIAHRKVRDRVRADAARRRREQEWGRCTAVPPRSAETQAVVADLLSHLEGFRDTDGGLEEHDVDRAVRRCPPLMAGFPGRDRLRRAIDALAKWSSRQSSHFGDVSRSCG
jgi:DNA-directed RNA polymerase specialized sigma24 family protein